jgi:hypothetical protein
LKINEVLLFYTENGFWIGCVQILQKPLKFRVFDIIVCKVEFKNLYKTKYFIQRWSMSKTSKLKIDSAKNFQDQDLFEYTFNDTYTVSFSDSMIFCTNTIKSPISCLGKCIHVEILLDTFNKSTTMDLVKMHTDMNMIHNMYLKEKDFKEKDENNCLICLNNIDYRCIKCIKCNSLLHKSCFLSLVGFSIENGGKRGALGCIVCKSRVYTSNLKICY